MRNIGLKLFAFKPLAYYGADGSGDIPSVIFTTPTAISAHRSSAILWRFSTRLEEQNTVSTPRNKSIRLGKPPLRKLHAMKEYVS